MTLYATWWCASMLWVGCAKPPEISIEKPATSKATPLAVSNAAPAAKVNLVETYKQLDAYSDETIISLTYHFDDGRQEVSTTSISTRFARPNKLNLRVASEENRVLVVSDGVKLSARIVDPITNDFDDQVVIHDAPAKMSIAEIYRVTELVDPLTPDELVSALLGVPVGLDMTPLGLVLNEGRLATLVSDTQQGHSLRDLGLQTLPDASDPTRYQVLSASAPEGTYRFWIEPRSGVVRRIEFPPTSTDLPPGLARMELVVESTDVRYAADDGFVSQKPGQQVSHFVLPPLPPATELLGKEIEGLVFESGDGQVLKLGSGETTVLSWFHNHPASRLVIEQLELARKRIGNSQVRFVPVFVESSDTLAALQSWSISTPTWLDPQDTGRDVLGVKQAPTTIVLGRDNTVQYYEIGANPNIGNDVVVVLERLLAGQDVAKETLAVRRDAAAAYQRQLALARGADGTSDDWVEQLETEIPPASKPTKLQLAKQWSVEDIAEPGSMLIVPGKKKHILVTDGWRQLVLLDALGATKRRIKLELPADDGITLLRAGKDERDRALIAAATRGGRYAFVFDFGGKLVMQYPRIASGQSVISDVTIGELDDGKPQLIVGWQGNIGVHGVSLAGKQLWSNRVMPDVNSLAVVSDGSGEDRLVAVAGELGSMYLVDATGRTSREVKLDSLSIHHVVAWPGSSRGFEALVSKDAPRGGNLGIHCCLALSAAGEINVIGANSDWKPVWDYVLPAGVQRHQTDIVQSIVLPDIGPAWIFAAPNGSIHIVSLDGKFRDFFTVGNHIRGLAGLRSVGEKSMLLIATDGDVTAYEVSPRSD